MELKERRQKWINSYLGAFRKKPCREVENALLGSKALDRLLIKSTSQNEVVTELLMKSGTRYNYRVLASSQVIDIYLGKYPDIESYGDLIDQVLFVLVSGYEMENKRRWELIYQLAYERSLRGRSLIVVYDGECDRVPQFEAIGFKHIKVQKKKSGVLY